MHIILNFKYPFPEKVIMIVAYIPCLWITKKYFTGLHMSPADLMIY